MEIEKLQSAIEAILFTMGDSVELEKLASAIGHDEETTRKLIHNMMDKYEAADILSVSQNSRSAMCSRMSCWRRCRSLRISSR